MLTSKQRAALRKEANNLEPLFQIGKGGVDEPMANSIAECLGKRELVKIRLLETSPYPAKDAAAELAEATGADVVQVIGRVVVLFLPKKKESAFDEILGITKKGGKTAKAAKPAKAGKPGKAGRAAVPGKTGAGKPAAGRPAKAAPGRGGAAQSRTGARGAARPGASAKRTPPAQNRK